MQLPDLKSIEAAGKLVYEHMQPSPQLEWPLLAQRCGCRVWVKHENHNPTGAFKVRGGLVYMSRLRQREPQLEGVVTATRGNHGQSVAFAAAIHGLHPVVVVPSGNSADKNRAMRALGVELVEYGADFDEAVPHAQQLARDRGLHRMPSFHSDLVEGVSTYALELLRARPGLDRVYVPIGLGSGICGVIAARDALGLDTEIVGVVAAGADAYARSLDADEVVTTASADTLADGMAVRLPSDDAFAAMRVGLERIVTVTDSQILAAMGYYFADTHNVAEGAGAAPLAALLAERDLNSGAEVALVLSGGNVDAARLRELLA